MNIRLLLSWKKIGIAAQFLLGGGLIFALFDVYAKFEELDIEKQRFTYERFESVIKIADHICNFEGSLKQRIDALKNLEEFDFPIDEKFCFQFHGKPEFKWASMVSPADGKFTSEYGCRRHPITQKSKQFLGINIANKEGTPVRAVHGGMVVSKLNAGGLGQHVTLDHGGGWRTYYGHLSAFSVEEGEIIEVGQEIGKMGRTGLTTGSVLTFMISRHGVFYNPKNKDQTSDKLVCR